MLHRRSTGFVIAMFLLLLSMPVNAASFSAVLNGYTNKSAKVYVAGTNATASMTIEEVGTDYVKLRVESTHPNTAAVWYVPFTSISDVRIITVGAQDSIQIRIR